MAMEEKNNSIVSQGATQSLFQDACIIIDQAQAVAGLHLFRSGPIYY